VSKETLSKITWIYAPFRSCGTHVWSTFRNCSEYTTFYEPLHEWLAEYQPSLSEKKYTAIKPYMSHGELDRDYFSEYLSKPEGGVPGYHIEFAYGQDSAAGTYEQNDLKVYFQSLIDHAGDHRVAFKCCRAPFLSGKLRSWFPGTTLTVYRNPVDQFESCYRFPGEYFLAVPLLLTSLCRSDIRLKCLADHLNLPPPPESGFTSRIQFYQAISSQLSPETHYLVAYTWWWICLLETSMDSDVVIDVNQAANSKELEAKFQDLQLPISLSDCHPRTYDNPMLSAKTILEIEQCVEKEILNYPYDNLASRCDAILQKTPSMSPSVMKRLDRLRSGYPGRSSALPHTGWSPSYWPDAAVHLTNSLDLLNRSHAEAVKHSSDLMRNFQSAERYSKDLERKISELQSERLDALRYIEDLQEHLAAKESLLQKHMESGS
jgi:hypothetical protein